MVSIFKYLVKVLLKVATDHQYIHNLVHGAVIIICYNTGNIPQAINYKTIRAKQQQQQQSFDLSIWCLFESLPPICHSDFVVGAHCLGWLGVLLFCLHTTVPTVCIPYIYTPCAILYTSTIYFNHCVVVICLLSLLSDFYGILAAFFLHFVLV